MSRNRRFQKMRLHITCPNCGAPMYAYKKLVMSPTFTEVSYECRDETCTARYVAAVQLLRFVRAPHVPRPGFKIKASPVTRTAQVKALELLPTADAPQDLEIIKEALPQTDLFYDTPSCSASEPWPPELKPPKLTTAPSG